MKITDLIRELTKRDTKTLTEKVLKTGEEYGELVKRVLPYQLVDGSLHKLTTKEQILEECADLYLCLYSVVADIGVSDSEFEEMVIKKSNKWAKLQLNSQDKRFDVASIPFEIHVTVKADENLDVDKFKLACYKLNVKPIILDLQKDQLVDVMTSSTIISNNRDIFEEVSRISNGLTDLGFNVIREKIETVPWHPAAPVADDDPMPADCYFESHLNVKVKHVDQLDALGEIAAEYGAHMSRNMNKKYDDGSFKNMVTLRNYTGGSITFNNQVNQLMVKIMDSGFTIDKHVVEFSIYDSKVNHDKSWLMK